MRISAAVLAAALAISATTSNIGGVEAKRVRKVRLDKHGENVGIDNKLASKILDDAAAAEEDSAYWDRYLQTDMMSIPPTPAPPTNPSPTNRPPTPRPPTQAPPTQAPPTNPGPVPPTQAPPILLFLGRFNHI